MRSGRVSLRELAPRSLRDAVWRGDNEAVALMVDGHADDLCAAASPPTAPASAAWCRPWQAPPPGPSLAKSRATAIQQEAYRSAGCLTCTDRRSYSSMDGASLLSIACRQGHLHGEPLQDCAIK